MNAPARWSRGDAFTAGAAARRLDLQLPTQISPSAGYKPRIASKTPIRYGLAAFVDPAKEVILHPLLLHEHLSFASLGPSPSFTSVDRIK